MARGAADEPVSISGTTSFLWETGRCGRFRITPGTNAWLFSMISEIRDMRPIYAERRRLACGVLRS